MKNESVLIQNIWQIQNMAMYAWRMECSNKHPICDQYAQSNDEEELETLLQVWNNRNRKPKWRKHHNSCTIMRHSAKRISNYG